MNQALEQVGEGNEILSVESLGKSFTKRMLWRVEEVRAVNGISFSIRRRSILGLVGESGCGKTTTARCIVGLERPSAGHIFFAGNEIGGLSARAFRPYRRKIQMVFQDPSDSLNPRYSVRNTIQEPLDIHTHLSRKDTQAKIRDILGLVGLRSELLDRYPHQLSTGQQQRVGLARAIVSDPELIVLDEPTASLDISVRGRVLELLLDLQERLGITYLLISHDLGTVHFICTETAVMYLGAIVEKGGTEELFRSPLHPYSQLLVGARPRLRGYAMRAERRQLVKGEVPSPLSLPTGCLFHTRCPAVMAICRESRPELSAVSSGRLVACHLYQSEHAGSDVGPTPGEKG
jgi:peptide/nickel transport system ATP-binding protein